MLKIIGAGLGRTGTTSLHEALQRMGYKSLHFDEHRLNDILDGSTQRPDFRRYDDVDAVSDVPAALFYNELLGAYPDARVILTVRNVDDWWRSIQRLFSQTAPLEKYPQLRHQIAKKLGLGWLLGRESDEEAFLRNLRNCTYGSPKPIESLYKRAYLQHNEAVTARVRPDRLLIMDIAAGDGWEKLCPFLGISVPSVPFPYTNRTRAFVDRDQAAPSSSAPSLSPLPSAHRPARPGLTWRTATAAPSPGPFPRRGIHTGDTGELGRGRRRR